MANDHPIELIARGVLLRRNHVLLCTNLKHGYHYLPGGHVEFGETGPEALLRELAEETDLPEMNAEETETPLLLLAEGHFRVKKREHHELNLVFHVEHPRGGEWPETVTSRESDIGFLWADLAAVVDMDLRPASIRAYLAAGGTIEGEGLGYVIDYGGI